MVIGAREVSPISNQLPNIPQTSCLSVTFAKLLLIQTVSLLIYRCVAAKLAGSSKETAATLEEGERWLKYGLVLESVVAFWWLFC